ncbi:MAG: hypothetical protein ABJA79_06315 [Parafilimonas sp.]
MNESFSIEREFGYQFYSFYRTDTSFIDPYGFKANLELRCYDILRKLKLKEKGSNVLTGLYAE